MAGLREWAVESAQALRAVARNPDLRRVELAWAGSQLGDWSWTIALAVVVYDRGGTAAVGILGLVRTLPAGLSAPFTSVLADRFPRERVMVATSLVRAAGLVGAAVAVALQAPLGVLMALAGFTFLVSTAFRPAQGALLPALASTPEELTAANVASSTIESVGMFGGPALGGILLAVTRSWVVFAAAAGMFLWSAWMVARIDAHAREPVETSEPGSVVAELFAGFRAIALDPPLRLLIGLASVQTLVCGILDVLVVVVALRLLHLGDGGAGYLFSATGVGGVVGAVAATALIGRRRLARAFALGVVLWGAPIALLAASSSTTAAVLLLALVGVANTIVDVACFTLLQRSVPDDVLGRVFGVLESVVLAMIAIGAILAPALVAGLGLRGALVATGVVLPVLVALTWRPLARLDAAAPPPRRELDLLRGLSLFAPLAPPVLEHLALSLEPVAVPAGTAVVREGEQGDRFYVVSEGTLAVDIGGRRGTALGPGDHFGEIALLRDVPRTATVTAETEAALFALSRDEFVGAVTGHPVSAEAADAVIATRLGSLRPGVASL